MPNRFHLAASVGQRRALCPCQISLSTFPLPARSPKVFCTLYPGTPEAPPPMEGAWQLRNPAESQHDSLAGHSPIPFVIHSTGVAPKPPILFVPH